MKVKQWKKIGELKTLIDVFGKKINLQRFEDPVTKEIREYSIFSATRGPSIILPISDNEEVLAVRQFRHGANKVLIELPGGNPKCNDLTPEQVAEEELFSETGGYKAEKLIRLNNGPLWFNPAVFTTDYYAFLALGCRKAEGQIYLDEGEYTELIKIPLNLWINMCSTGKILDTKSIAVTFMALRYLGLKITR